MSVEKKAKGKQNELDQPYNLHKDPWILIFKMLSAIDLASIHLTSSWFHKIAPKLVDVKLTEIAEKHGYSLPAPGLKFEKLYFSNDSIPEEIGSKNKLFELIRKFDLYYSELFDKVNLDKAMIANLHPLLKYMLVEHCSYWMINKREITNQKKYNNMVALYNTTIDIQQQEKMMAVKSLCYLKDINTQWTILLINKLYQTEIITLNRTKLISLFSTILPQKSAPRALIKHLINVINARPGMHSKLFGAYTLGAYTLWELGLWDTHAEIAENNLTENGWWAISTGVLVLPENQKYLLENMATLNSVLPEDQKYLVESMAALNKMDCNKIFMPTWNLEEFLSLNEKDKKLLRKLQHETIAKFQQFQEELKALDESRQQAIVSDAFLGLISSSVFSKINTVKRLNTLYTLYEKKHILAEVNYSFGSTMLEEKLINYCANTDDFCGMLVSACQTQPIGEYINKKRHLLEAIKLTTFFIHYLCDRKNVSSDNQNCLENIDLRELPESILEKVYSENGFNRVRIILKLKQHRYTKYLGLSEPGPQAIPEKEARIKSYEEIPALWHHSPETLEQYVGLANCVKSSDLIVSLLKRPPEFVSNISLKRFSPILNLYVEDNNADINPYEWVIDHMLTQDDSTIDIIIQQLKKLTSQVELKGYVEQKVKNSDAHEKTSEVITPNWFKLINELIDNKNKDKANEFLRQLFNPKTSLFNIFDQAISCDPLEFIDALWGPQKYKLNASTRICEFYSRKELFQYFDKECDFVHLFHFYIGTRSLRVFEKDLVYQKQNAIQWLSKPSHKALTRKLLMDQNNKDEKASSCNLEIQLSFKRFIRSFKCTIYTGELSEQKLVNKKPQEIVALFIQHEILDNPNRCLSLLEHVGMDPEKLAEELNPTLETKLKRKPEKSTEGKKPFKFNFFLEQNKPAKPPKKNKLFQFDFFLGESGLQGKDKKAKKDKGNRK